MNEDRSIQNELMKINNRRTKILNQCNHKFGIVPEEFNLDDQHECFHLGNDHNVNADESNHTVHNFNQVKQMAHLAKNTEPPIVEEEENEIYQMLIINHNSTCS